MPLLERSDALATWFEELRRHASDASPEAAKAAEWLIDNDYVLRRAIREVKRDMPARFYRDLPRLAGTRISRLAQGLVRRPQRT